MLKLLRELYLVIQLIRFCVPVKLEEDLALVLWKHGDVDDCLLVLNMAYCWRKLADCFRHRDDVRPHIEHVQPLVETPLRYVENIVILSLF